MARSKPGLGWQKGPTSGHDGGRVRRLWSVAALTLLLFVLLDVTNISRRADLLGLAALLAGTMGGRLVTRRRSAELQNRLILVSVSVLACLILTEILFRSAFVKPRIPTTEAEFARIVSDDWPRPIPVTRETDAYRLLGLADSFGRFGGPSNYHYVLEGLLRRLVPDLEVVNLSVPGYELRDELELLQWMGIRYRPDLVLQGFFVGNDFNDVGGIPIICRGMYFRDVTGLARLRPASFACVRWVRNHLQVRLDRRRLQKEGEGDGGSGKYSRHTFLRILRDRSRIYRRGFYTGGAWPEVQRALDGTREVVARAGARYVMVLHPSQSQVESALWDEVIARFALDPADYDLDLPQKILQQFCEARGITCVDLLPAFRREGERGGLYAEQDTHYSPAGNALAARIISEHLIEGGLLE